VICIINLNNKLLKGVTRGGPLGTLYSEAKFQQDAKYKVITLKKNKRHFEGRYKGGPLGELSH